MLPQISQSIIDAFQAIGAGTVSFIVYKLLPAIIVVIIGWIIAVTIGRLVSQLVGLLKIDKILQKTGIEVPLSRAGISLNTGAFLGALVRWFFIIVALVVTMDILGLEQVNMYLRDVVLLYLPNVIIAALLLVAAAILADLVQKGVVASSKAAKLPAGVFLGGVSKWAIWVFAILAALYQLGIAGPLIQTLFTGLIAMMAIAGGLAFGLGGKEAAANFIGKLKRDISH